MSNTYYVSALQCAGLVQTHIDTEDLLDPPPPPPQKKNNDQIGHLALNNNNSMTRRFGV